MSEEGLNRSFLALDHEFTWVQILPACGEETHCETNNRTGELVNQL